LEGGHSVVIRPGGRGGGRQERRGLAQGRREVLEGDLGPRAEDDGPPAVSE
jgi:hypothetical protein